MKIISYYTKNTPYEQVINTHLLPSLKKWNLDYDIEAIPDLGNWYENTGYKPIHILKMLEKHKQDVCFLDADAVVEQYPSLIFQISNEWDLACHMLDWYRHWRNVEGKTKRELLSGTMIWKYKPKVLTLCEQYIAECGKFPTVWEQKILQRILQNSQQYKLYELPVNYCVVVNKDNQIPQYINDPVIVHWQKSRTLKKN